MTRNRLKTYLAQAVKAVFRIDKNICTAVPFGSAVYAPKLANDLNLLVSTVA